jgi:hypothetical protein
MINCIQYLISPVIPQYEIEELKRQIQGVKANPTVSTYVGDTHTHVRTYTYIGELKRHIQGVEANPTVSTYVGHTYTCT